MSDDESRHSTNRDGDDRREADRRNKQVAIPGKDRRVSERRGGDDRRKTDRRSGIERPSPPAE